jgi:hypothetical protein
MSKRVEKQGLREKPINLDEHNWYYEDKGGIDVIHEIRDEEGNYYRTDHIKIPWKKLLESVKRKYGI